MLSGVYLSFNGVTIPSDGYIPASDITGPYSDLLCNTDRSDCCRRSDNPNGVAQGHWYYPDGREVMSYTVEYYNTSFSRNFFYRNRGTRIVRLNRHGYPPERGRFRCEIPNAAGDMVNLYVNIGEWFVSSSIVDSSYLSISFCSSGHATSYSTSATHRASYNYH